MIGIIGGSGFYELLEGHKHLDVMTPYGRPSSKIAVGEIQGKKVAFISRHGEGHKYPPHKVPYKASIYALKQLGIKQIISATAVGSLKVQIRPGDFLVPDQLANFTSGREDTFYNGDSSSVEKCVVHLSFADPFCNHIRNHLIKTLKSQEHRFHQKGTAVVINGPRFSTKAESNLFRNQNWDIVNMTLYPEALLARELEICYANISLITDYDTGVKEDNSVESVTVEDVMKTFKENSEKLKNIIKEVAFNLDEKDCTCQHALEGSRMG
ncbi:MAG: S-methyl-5'-thioadenosine phosphorylase [Candidatus Aenigmarchaeota archaeon]|nr:S-methyl-5'-thioadenosine phosphorylase [Candidatus Aenigmarchaeota archaeon]